MFEINSTIMKSYLIIIFLLSNVCAQHWNYENVDDWPKMYSSCGGNHMSPINIRTDEVVDKSLNMNFINYGKPNSFMVQNTGHSARVYLSKNDLKTNPRITGSVVGNDMYSFDSLHFHWGEDNNGTEHSFDGYKESMELHLVHWNTKYGNISNASDKPDGLAVISVLYKTIRFLNIIDNMSLRPITNALATIKEFGSNANIENQFDLDSLLPFNKYEFYRYSGSLTTPPCSQSVTFILFSDKRLVSSNQLTKFRELRAEPENGISKALTENCRKQYPLNGRIVNYFINEN